MGTIPAELHPQPLVHSSLSIRLLMGMWVVPVSVVNSAAMTTACRRLFTMLISFPQDMDLGGGLLAQASSILDCFVSLTGFKYKAETCLELTALLPGPP